MKGIRNFKKGDIFLIILVGIIGIAVLVPTFWNKYKDNVPPDSLIAVITRDGKKMAEIDLKKVGEPKYLTYEDGIRVKIMAENGQIRFLEADCPDKICIKTGTLTKQGERAVCLPSKTIVTIKGEGKLVSFFLKDSQI